ncbi:MAG: right-handed parallel beta-helix repeat-containing protein [Chloroflexi bacterium]|nr:right-handed parallel beta-helix repeat-containing protein [Chloroflexota bacterium]
MRRKELSVLVVVETTVLGLVAMGVFAVLVDQYDRAMGIVAERTAVAHTTAVFVALLSTTPPTPTASNTPSPTRTFTPTKTQTVSPTPTITLTPAPSSTPKPTKPPTATRPPQPTRTPAPVVPPTPRPATSVPSSAVSGCGTIDKSGNYSLTGDLTSSGDCISIAASNVVLDCAGHAIRGANFTGYGIAVRNYGLLGTQSPSNVEIRNCNVSNYTYGIYIQSGDHHVVRDSNSSNNYDDTDPTSRFGKFLGMVEGGGIRVNNATNAQILGNTTVHQAIGIDVRYSSGVLVQGNTASDNSAWGINILRTQNSQVLNNTTADNVRKCTWGAGTVGYGCDAGGIVVQDGANGNVVSNNTVIGRNGNGVFIKAHALPCGNNNTISGNTISSVLYNAVELGFCTGNKVDNNQMRDGLDGVWIGFAHDNEINGNTIVGMHNHGIISSNSRNNTVSGNQIISSNEGLYFYSEDYDHAAFAFLPAGDYRSYGNCLCGNTLQSNSIAIHLQDSTSNQVTNNTYRDNGRTFLVQGNSDGNNLQGFAGDAFPWARGVAALWFPR